MPTYDILSPVKDGAGLKTSGTIDLAEEEAGSLVARAVLALSSSPSKKPSPAPAAATAPKAPGAKTRRTVGQ